MRVKKITEEETYKLVRDMCYRWTVEESARHIYKMINGKEIPPEVEVVNEPVEQSINAHGNNHAIVIDDLRDERGEKVWFPNDRRPYFDKSLQRTFNTKKEKQQYMKKNKLAMDGSSNPKRWDIDAGDNRERSYRKSMRMED